LTDGQTYSQFRAAFRDATGLAPYQYRLQARINHAKDLLRGTDLLAKEIAATCGFSDPYQFSRQFRHKTGFSPIANRSQSL
jgi:AraC family transcriptional regulator